MKKYSVIIYIIILVLSVTAITCSVVLAVKNGKTEEPTLPTEPPIDVPPEPPVAEKLTALFINYDSSEYYRAEQTVGSAFVLPPETPEYQEHEFLGWFLDMEIWNRQVTTELVVEASMSQEVGEYAGKILLFSKWSTIPGEEDVYFEVLVDNGHIKSNGKDKATVLAGVMLTLVPDIPDGKVFDYWLVDDEYRSYSETLVFPVKNNTHAVAVFKDGVRFTARITDGFFEGYEGTELTLTEHTELKAVPVVPSGKSFEKWIVTQGSSMRYEYASDYAFTLVSEISLAATFVDAADAWSVNAQFEFLEDEGYRLVSYAGAQTQLEIPAQYDDGINGVMPITRISPRLFSEEVAPKITKLTLPDSLLYIENSALAGCFGLTELTVPFIGESPEDQNAYVGKLFGTVIKNKLTAPLATITITKATTVGAYAFTGAENLKKIEFLALELLGADSIRECVALEELVLPSTLTQAETNAISYCSKLDSVTIPASLTVIPEELFGLGMHTQNLILSQGVTALETKALFNLPLAELTIPESVTSVGEDALNRNVIKVTMQSATPVQINSAAFGLPRADFMLFVPDGAADAYKGLACYDAYKAYIYTPSMFGADGFAVDNGVLLAYTGVLPIAVIPEGITKINSCAFDSLSALTKIIIPSSVTVIEVSPQKGPFVTRCEALAAIEVDSDNTSFCAVDGVLYNKACTQLYLYPPAKSGAAFTAPETVAAIRVGAFVQVEELENIYLNNTETIESYNFLSCPKLKKVDGSKVRYVGESLGSGSSVLTDKCW